MKKIYNLFVVSMSNHGRRSYLRTTDILIHRQWLDSIFDATLFNDKKTAQEYINKLKVDDMRTANLYGPKYSKYGDCKYEVLEMEIKIKRDEGT